MSGVGTRVLLVGPFKNADLRVGQFLSPPNGIYRISSFVSKKTGATVDVIDCDLDGVAKFEDSVLNGNYDIIGFSLLYPTIKNDMELICRAKSLSPRAILIAGGQGAAFCEELLFSSTPLDVVVRGFGEFPIAEMVDKIAGGAKTARDFRGIHGLYVRDGEGFEATPLREPYTSGQYHEIASAFDYAAVPYERYWEYMESKYTPEQLEVMKNDGLLYTIRIMTSSHCPMKCSFCSATNFLDDAVGKRQCALSMEVDEVVRAVKEAKESHPGVKAFYFVDDNLLQNRERAMAMCRRLVQEFKKDELNFFCLSRVDNIDSSLLTLMKAAGFKLVIYGVESFSNKVLREMSKKVASPDPARTAENAILQTLSSGITPLMNLILFYPTTTIDDILETIGRAVPLVEKGARLTAYSFVEVYPGSDIMKQGGLEIKSESFEVAGKKVEVPSLIMPRDPEVKDLAISSSKLRDALVEGIKGRHAYGREVPHPVFALALFLSIHMLLGKPTERIEALIDAMMAEAKEKESAKVRA